MSRDKCRKQKTKKASFRHFEKTRKKEKEKKKKKKKKKKPILEFIISFCFSQNALLFPTQLSLHQKKKRKEKKRKEKRFIQKI